ncbi:flagellar assembly protein FlbE, partial [Salmonella sp. gx-h1]|nr:flagellar assembly protein FlbE [Salmonella sp. gx-h1]
MNASAQDRRPFVFDTEFDADRAVVRPSAWTPTKRAYLPAEVDALVAQARLEARQQALN